MRINDGLDLSNPYDQITRKIRLCGRRQAKARTALFRARAEGDVKGAVRAGTKLDRENAHRAQLIAERAALGKV